MAGLTQGRFPMQNALLIGLSRQMTLERQMDVIANNVANANTNGFKADHSLFEEFLNSNAREDNFIGVRPPGLLCAGPRHLPRRRPGADGADQQPARHGDRRQRLLRGAGQWRRTLHPRRQVLAQQHRPARHLRRQPRARHRRPDHLPADRPRHQRRARRHRHGARRHRQDRLDPRQDPHGCVRRCGQADQARRQPLRRRLRDPAGRSPSRPCARATSRSPTSTRSAR